MDDNELFGNSEQLNDLISRQAVIEINRSYHGQMPNEVNHRIWKEINELPSAQPETHEERTETHACDLISRQAAIDAMMKLQTEDIEAYGASIPEGFDGDRAVTALKALPSAQQNCDGCKWSDAIGYGECHHCKRAYDDMYEKGVQP